MSTEIQTVYYYTSIVIACTMETLITEISTGEREIEREKEITEVTVLHVFETLSLSFRRNKLKLKPGFKALVTTLAMHRNDVGGSITKLRALMCF